MRSFCVLVNPHAGSSNAAASGEAVARLLRAAGAEVTVSETETPEQAARLAGAAASRGDVVVVAGGDGTIGPIAGAVSRVGGTLGLVPAGRGNDFARQLGLASDPRAIAGVLLDGTASPVDLIEVAGRTVVGSVYAGIDSLVCELVNRARWLPTVLQYPVAAVRAIFLHRPTSYAVTIDGIEHAVDAHTIVVANSGFYGSGMRVAPGARIDDGILSVVTIAAAGRSRPENVLRLLNALRLVYSGRHIRLDEVAVRAGSEVTIASTGALVAWADGDLVGPLPVTARVLPGALKVLR